MSTATHSGDTWLSLSYFIYKFLMLGCSVWIKERKRNVDPFTKDMGLRICTHRV